MDEEQIIENKALSYLTELMRQYIRTHELKEKALAFPSYISFIKFYASLDTLLEMITAKDIDENSLNRVEKLKKSLHSIENGNKPLPEKIQELRQILRETAEIIRKHRWFDMPKPKERGFNLIEEFYGGGNGETSETSSSTDKESDT